MKNDDVLDGTQDTSTNTSHTSVRRNVAIIKVPSDSVEREAVQSWGPMN